MTRIKICGITTLEDALACAELGADMLGFNFYRKTPRYIAPDTVSAITDTLRQNFGVECPLLVGVFVNESRENIRQIMDGAGLDLAQLSGDEPSNFLSRLDRPVIKAIRPRQLNEACDQSVQYIRYAPQTEHMPSILVDAYHKELYGGTGEQASIEVALAAKALVPRLMLAGGLTPDNVATRVQAIQPWAVDVASGVESGTPGVKNRDKVQAFIRAVHLAPGDDYGFDN
ncbi:MAG TPA: phosphoribosylanthranilate isomerase [Aggregatilineaceae bacterium]|nr:phosphoribosylanthranilate isomerase [Aggregatilineaceae bacterium]